MLAAKTVLMLFNIYALNYSNSAWLNSTRSEMSIAEEAARKRVTVKLNMKQTLIMNQAIATYALQDSGDELCRNHSREFRDGLRAFEPWALQMLDASSKAQAGVLAGNLMEFGSFRQCVKVFFRSQYGPIAGKHCALSIRPTEKVLKKMLSFRNITERRYEKVKSSMAGASIHWSVCVPEVCSPEDALEHFNKTIMSIVEGLEVDISLSELDCYSESEELPLSRSERVVLGIFLGYFLIIVICTILDIWNRQKEVPKPMKVAEIFSMYSNVQYLSSYKKEGTNLDCLHGIRCLSICYVIFGHKYLMSLFFPSVNSLEILEWFLKYPSTLILGATVSVDSFFLMSGLLVSYYFFEHMSKGGKFNFGLFCINRYIRLTPSYAVVILFVTTLGQRMGSGPLWKRVCASVQRPCHYFWWSALLHTQTYTNPRHTCILQTWYLSCEMQYYVFAPIIMYPLWKWKIFGMVNIVLLYILSVCSNFYFAWTHEYTAGDLMDTNLPSSDYFANHYIQPYIRSSTYILGLGLGYALQRTRDTKIKMGKVILVCGWLFTATIMATVILSYNHFELEEYDYNRLEMSFFISMHRSAWVLGLMWIIWACRFGYGGPVNSLLSAHIFQIFGRITYSMFLIHMPLQFLSLGALKLPTHFSNYDRIHSALGDVALSLLLGFLLTILVEYPCVRISLLFFKAGLRAVAPRKN